MYTILHYGMLHKRIIICVRLCSIIVIYAMNDEGSEDI